jgi:hypothetical protein
MLQTPNRRHVPAFKSPHNFAGDLYVRTLGVNVKLDHSYRNMRAPYLVCLLYVVLLAGCGQEGPELAEVSGRVTLDGQPLELVDVVFQPSDGTPPSTGRTDADGRYQLLYKRGMMGARTGEHTVRIDFTSNIVANPPKIPARYNTATELRREVKAGDDNVFDFELTSEPK